MEFKSQVATSIEQSKRLLELGLKKETADCVYVTDERVPEEYRHYDLVPEYYESCLDGIVNIPAWSLHRIIAMIADTQLQVGSQVGIHVEDTYDIVIQGIEWLISRGHFNKDYLEERK